MGEGQSLRNLEIFLNSNDYATFLQMVILSLNPGLLEYVVIANWQFTSHPRISLRLGNDKKVRCSGVNCHINISNFTRVYHPIRV